MALEYKIDKRTLRSAPINGYAGRREGKPVSIEKQLVHVISPEGEIVECMRHVANDRVRHLGWKWAHKVVEETTGEEQIVEAVQEVTPAEVAMAAEPEVSEPNETELALAYLESLRDEAEKLGIKVDQRWGKKRLSKEIAAAKSVDADE